MKGCEKLLTVESVRKRYGSAEVLRGVSFSVPGGSAAAIIGKNGCGKSTLLAILAGALLPDSGRVSFAVPNVKVGYLPQDDCLFSELSVADNLIFWAAAAGISRGEALSSRYAELLGLGEVMKKRVSRLSGGMRRRAAVCSLLLHNPAVLLLDEPFAGLDLIARKQLILFLSALCRAEGRTIIYSTHSPEELKALSDTTLLLENGEIVSVEDTEELLQTKDAENRLINLIGGFCSKRSDQSHGQS